ncbi:nucleotidyltransferase domain-containing protein [Bacillus salacetis]|uniref:nucleotidyltransferase domain-containing protein n=1 Tax=Bacillus salacetis TaxID=2315464 RepID=UPI0014447EC3|nr:nucleotidyltransferase domain-containing protein [Bacillus salacetis]
MLLKEKANTLLYRFTNWTETQDSILAAAVVGSFARGDYHEGSDVDLVIITTDKKAVMRAVFSDFVYETIIRFQIEEWGPYLSSLRIVYDNGLEVEFGVTTVDWVKEPLDSGTKNVVKDGFRSLLDKEGLFGEINQFLEEK